MMQGPASPVAIPGTAKRSPPRPQEVDSHALKDGSDGYQLDLSQEHVMQELNARHSASVAAKLDALKQQQAQQSRQQGQGQAQLSPGQQRDTRPMPRRELSPSSEFWRQQQEAQRTVSLGLQEVLVYSGHYASDLPPVPGGVTWQTEREAAAAAKPQPANVTTQSPRGSLATGLAGLAVSGARSEFPVVPAEATLVKATLTWAATSGAQSVEVKGSYDGWGPARRLQRQPDGSWAIDAYLAPGVYQYKYVVDGVWRYDPWAPVVRDEDGNLNNVLGIIDPCTSFDIPIEFDPPPSPPSSYKQELPAAGDLAMEPPLLPPQANLTALDLELDAGAASWPEAGEPRPLHPAEHAVLNHIYVARSTHKSSAPESELPKEPLILGATIRYRAKHVVTLMYKPRPPSRHIHMPSSGRLASGGLADANR